MNVNCFQVMFKFYQLRFSTREFAVLSLNVSSVPVSSVNMSRGINLTSRARDSEADVSAMSGFSHCCHIAL